MKVRTSNVFVLIWVSHCFIYYATYAIMIRILKNDFKEFYFVFLAFINSFIGLFERIPLFPLIPLVIMYILIREKLKNNWFLAYLIAVGASYSMNYIWLFLRGKHMITMHFPDPTNVIYFIIPSMLVSIVFNWLIFRNQYNARRS